ncbi:tubulin binding cofactor C-domain-containing protein [Lactarius indigo]|nr:tubulin binding cofactor C-domain-containing protein [Lactarius indigo]
MFEPIDKAFQQDFYSQFQASRADLIARLDVAKHSPTSDNDWQELALNTRKLRKYLTEATTFLPSYDQRQCQAQMELLEQSLEETRSASLPKKKFAFKRKADRPPVLAVPTLPPSPQATPPQPGLDHLSTVSTFHTLSAQSNCRLSFRSLPTFGDDTPTFDLTISDLNRCIVDLCSPANIASPRHQLSLTALHIRDLKNTILVLPHVKGSVLLHNLHTCMVIFRMHSSTNVRVYLSAVSNPVIEDCSAITFAEYPPFFASLNPLIADALPSNSNHADIQDFSHIRPTPSPNWTIFPPRNENWDDLLTQEDPSPQEIDNILIAHLPDATSGEAT